MNKCLFLILALLSVIILGCRPEDSETGIDESDEITAASPDELGRDIMKWSEAFPRQAADNDKNYEQTESPTAYNGSFPFQRWDLTPEIITNFSGIAFSKDYKEDRGHVYAWDDLFETERTSEKTPGACITCKTSDLELIFEQYGWDYASMKMYDFEESGHSGIDCLSCHDEETQHLRVIQPAYIEAAAAYGLPAEEMSDRELRTAVCAQCHSEYYFEPGTTKVVFPWTEGLSPSQIYDYYQSVPSGFTGDFTNPVSDTRLLKAQHPDYEMFQSGIHASAGIVCTDCHMPRVSTEGEDGGSETITQHHITSPLKTIEESCLVCHQGKTAEWMLERTRYIQDSVFAALRRAGIAIEDAHKTIAATADGEVSDPVLTEAKQILHEAQWYWDFTASANSTGFHNSELAHSNLNTAVDLAHRSRMLILESRF